MTYARQSSGFSGSAAAFIIAFVVFFAIGAVIAYILLLMFAPGDSRISEAPAIQREEAVASAPAHERFPETAVHLLEIEPEEIKPSEARKPEPGKRGPDSEENSVLQAMAEIAGVKLRDPAEIALAGPDFVYLKVQFRGINDVVAASESRVDEFARAIKEKRLKGRAGIDYEVQELVKTNSSAGATLPPVVHYSEDEVVVEEIQGATDGKVFRKLVRINPGEVPAFDKLQDSFRNDSNLRKRAFLELLYRYQLVH